MNSKCVLACDLSEAFRTVWIDLDNKECRIVCDPSKYKEMIKKTCSIICPSEYPYHEATFLKCYEECPNEFPWAEDINK